MSEMELIVASQLNAVEVFTGKDGVEKLIADIEAKVLAFTPDTSTAKGRKEIAALSYKVSQSKVVLDDLGKALVSDWKDKAAKVDASRKIARDRLDALRDKAREPLTLWEEAEETRIAAEKLAAAAQAEAERKEAERKAADIEHRREVNREVIAGLVTAGLSEKQAKNVITAIVGGLVNHVIIKY